MDKVGLGSNYHVSCRPSRARCRLWVGSVLTLIFWTQVLVHRTDCLECHYNLCKDHYILEDRCHLSINTEAGRICLKDIGVTHST